jgi:hypothetical protein
MFRYWAKHPPLGWMVAAYLGIKSEDAPKPSYMNADDMRRMMRQTGGRIPGVGQM